jgi:hypothetical protein
VRQRAADLLLGLALGFLLARATDGRVDRDRNVPAPVPELESGAGSGSGDGSLTTETGSGSGSLATETGSGSGSGGGAPASATGSGSGGAGGSGSGSGGAGGSGSGSGGAGGSGGGSEGGRHDAGVARGRLAREAIRDVVREALPHFRFCFEWELARHPDLRGRVTLQFRIAEDGTVVDPGIAEDALGDETVLRCFRGVVGRLRFPPPEGGPVDVRYPLVLSPDEDPAGI